jgi:hypothetical protein
MTICTVIVYCDCLRKDVAMYRQEGSSIVGPPLMFLFLEDNTRVPILKRTFILLLKR